jgi:hypothetical protein
MKADELWFKAKTVMALLEGAAKKAKFFPGGGGKTLRQLESRRSKG